MKKVALAAILAIATSAAFAQSSVTLYGRASEFVGVDKAGNASRQYGLTSDNSYFGFKSQEDLGNGVGVRAVIEQGFDMTGSDRDQRGIKNKDSFGNRQATVGVYNQFGSVDLGRKEHALYTAEKSLDPFNGYYGTAFTAIHPDRDQRLSNAVFANVAPIYGVSGEVDYGFNSLDNSNATAASIGGTVGPVHGVAAYYTGRNNTRTELFGVSGTVPVTGTFLSAAYSTNQDLGVRTQGTTLSVAQPITPVLSAKASVGEASDNTRAVSVGVGYALSKRTSVDLIGSSVTSQNENLKDKKLALGLTHAF